MFYSKRPYVLFKKTVCFVQEVLMFFKNILSLHKTGTFAEKEHQKSTIS